jgi:hypothetical protein
LSAGPEFVLLSQFELVAQQLDQVCPEDHHQMNKFLTLKTNATYNSGASHHQCAQQGKGTFTLSTITEMTKVGDVDFQHIYYLFSKLCQIGTIFLQSGHFVTTASTPYSCPYRLCTFTHHPYNL